MKKLGLIIAIVVLLSSLLSVCANATSLTEGVESILETKEIYAAIPEGFIYSPVYEEDTYFVFVDEEYNAVYIDMQTNTDINEGITNLSEDEIKDLFIIGFILEGNEEYYDYYDVNFSKCEKTTINGVKAYMLEGDYAWIEEGMTAEDIYRLGFNCYITATEENVYYVAIVDDDEIFDENEEMRTLINSVCVNGTYFDGDKLTVSKDFSSYESYSQVLAAELTNYFENYEDIYGDVGMEGVDGSLYPDSIGVEGRYFVIAGIVVATLTTVPVVILLIVAIVLIVKYSKKKKKVKELEGKQLTGFMYQQSVSQPYAAQPVPQPINAQPVPQPLNLDKTEQKTILNGEIQQDNQ